MIYFTNEEIEMLAESMDEYADFEFFADLVIYIKNDMKVKEEKAWICANMRNGNWYCSGYFVLQTAFNNKKLRELGYPTFTEFYLKICEN